MQTLETEQQDVPQSTDVKRMIDWDKPVDMVTPLMGFH